MEISNGGVVKINAFPSANGGLVMANTSGELTRTELPANANLFLDGNGQFSSLDTITGWKKRPSGDFVTSGTGYVGIGTNTPLLKLHVNGDALIDGYIFAKGISFIGSAWGDKVVSDTIDVKRLELDSTKLIAGETRIDGGASVTGNLGVGTKWPTEKLDVYGNAKVREDLEVNGKSSFNARADFYEDVKIKYLEDVALAPTDQRVLMADKYGKLTASSLVLEVPTTLTPENCDYDIAQGRIGTTLITKVGNSNYIFHGTGSADCNDVKVGIGTYAPTANLDVRGTAKISSLLTAAEISSPLATITDLNVSDELQAQTTYLKGNTTIGTVSGNQLKIEPAVSGGATANHIYTTTGSVLKIQSNADGNNTIINGYPNGGSLFVGGTESGTGIGTKLIAIGDNTVNTTPLVVKNAQGSRILFSVNNSGAGWNWLAQAGDAGIFWSDNNTGLNTSSGFVIAPHADAASGIRIDRNGNVAIAGSLSGTNQWTQSGSNLYFNTGSVGIGTATPDTQYKLDVCGNIHAKKIVINTTGCDFVFEPTYQLMPLDERGSYLKQNRRLPNVVSAKEMEEKGTDMGTTMMGILQNTEELNLYILQLHDRIKLLEETILEIKKASK